MANKNLNAAKVAKKDEFYTQLSDIERELQHYWQHFHGKVVLCNCDDPYESNFFKYFALRFNQLGLKKLICTCYDGSPVQGTELIFRFDGKKKDAKCIAVFHIGNIRWYFIEGQTDGEDFIFYGVVLGLVATEYGYVSANEMASITIDASKYGLGILQVEQDKEFKS